MNTLSELKDHSHPESNRIPLNAGLVESEWYAVYTRSHQERRVKTQLDGKEVENFLPTFEKISQWKDRKKPIQLPLFPGYLFVKISLLRRLEVLKA
jgi:hypothetical protein